MGGTKVTDVWSWAGSLAWKKEELEESRENEGFCMRWSRFTLGSGAGGATDSSVVAISRWLHGGTALLKHRKCALQSRSVTLIHGNRHGHTAHIGSKLGNHRVRSFPYCLNIFVMFAPVISFLLLQASRYLLAAEIALQRWASLSLGKHLARKPLCWEGWGWRIAA